MVVISWSRFPNLMWRVGLAGHLQDRSTSTSVWSLVKSQTVAAHQQAQTSFFMFCKQKLHLFLLIVLWSWQPDIHLLCQYLFILLEGLDWPGKKGTASLYVSQKTWEKHIVAILSISGRAALCFYSFTLMGLCFSPVFSFAWLYLKLLFAYEFSCDLYSWSVYFFFSLLSFHQSESLHSFVIACFSALFRLQVQGLSSDQLDAVFRTFAGGFCIGCQVIWVDEQLIQLWSNRKCSWHPHHFFPAAPALCSTSSNQIFAVSGDV